MSTKRTNKNSEKISAVSRQIKKGTSVEKILVSDSITSFTTKGTLSNNQKGLVAVTVALMQERIIDILQRETNLLHLHIENQRKSSSEAIKGMAYAATAGVRQAWATPLVHSPENQSAENRPTWKGLLNWGNFMTLSAVILLCVAIFYTKAYTSYKDRVTNQASIITDLKGEKSSLSKNVNDLLKSNDSLNQVMTKLSEEVIVERVGRETAQNEARLLNNSISFSNKEQRDLNEENKELRDEIGTLKAKLAAANTKADGKSLQFKTYKQLFRDCERKKDDRDKTLTRVNNENTKLKTEIESLRKEKSNGAKGSS